jgi:hypothetical protein
MGKRGGGSPGAEHIYDDEGARDGGSNAGTMSHGSPASIAASKGSGPVPGAGQLDYGYHGNPGKAASRYVGMDPGEYPSRKTPNSQVGKMDVYKEGNPPPRGYSQGGPRRSGRRGDGGDGY